MPRWEPDARTRLEAAALALYSEQGFDQTTVEEIAKRAGVTRRTFFRHFADKREVLFGSGHADGLVVKAALQSAPHDASPLDVVGMALVALAAKIDSDGEAAVRRIRIVRASPELWERQLMKFTALAEALAIALRARGVRDPAAILAAESGITALRVASDSWIADTNNQSLQGLVAEAVAELRAITSSPRRPRSTQPSSERFKSRELLPAPRQIPSPSDGSRTSSRTRGAGSTARA